MIDRHRDPDEAEARRAVLPDFTPVPRLCNRHDGWTPERQRRFIEALADTGSVRSAALAVNMAPEGVYALRRHAEAQEFRAAWEAALALGVQRLEDIAMERAIDGVEVPVLSAGKHFGTRRHYNDHLLMFLLRNRAPRRFGAEYGGGGRMNLADAAQLANLKRQWRAEWEKQRRAQEHEEDQKACDELDRMLETMSERRLARMSPRTRRLHDAYQRSLARDDARASAPEPDGAPDDAPPPLALPAPAGDDGEE